MLAVKRRSLKSRVLAAAGTVAVLLLGCAPIPHGDWYAPPWPSYQRWELLLDCPRQDGVVVLSTGEIGGVVRYDGVRFVVRDSGRVEINRGPDIPGLSFSAKRYTPIEMMCGGAR